MKNSVYCIASTESQANDILQHLRNLGFASSEVSVLLKTKDTKNITVEEDAIRDAEKGSLVGGIHHFLGTDIGTTRCCRPCYCSTRRSRCRGCYRRTRRRDRCAGSHRDSRRREGTNRAEDWCRGDFDCSAVG